MKWAKKINSFFFNFEPLTFDFCDYLKDIMLLNIGRLFLGFGVGLISYVVIHFNDPFLSKQAF